MTRTELEALAANSARYLVDAAYSDEELKEKIKIELEHFFLAGRDAAAEVCLENWHVSDKMITAIKALGKNSNAEENT